MQKQLNENLKMTRIRLQPANAYEREDKAQNVKTARVKLQPATAYKEVNEPKISESENEQASIREHLKASDPIKPGNGVYKKPASITYSIKDLIDIITDLHQENLEHPTYEPFLNLNLQLLKHIKAKKGKINVGFKFETSNNFASDKAILILKA